ncbi:MAG: hypothetical protein H6707_02785 [Deltaproteobacteria bacterium]|nr:hypothetical protein [Deltaproteobacteria bacterium]
MCCATRALTIAAALFVAGPVGAQQRAELPRPFPQGSLNLGLAFGFAAGGGGTAFSAGGAAGYYVLNGLEPGLQFDVTVSSDAPTVVALLPYLRWVIFRSYAASPYIKAQGGRLFVVGSNDLSAIGGGGGMYFFLRRNIAFQLEAVALRLFPSSICGDNCTSVDVGMALSFIFGRSPRPVVAPTDRRAPGEPATPAPAADEPLPTATSAE